MSGGPSGRSVVRRVLGWWFGSPASPSVNANAVVDVTAALAYVGELKAAGRSITLHHLVAGAIGRALLRHPIANARFFGGRLEMVPDVGVAMPVNLLGHAEGQRRELGLVVVEGAGTASLVEIAERTRGRVESERRGQTENGFIRALLRTAERTPGWAVPPVLEAVSRVLETRGGARAAFRAAPITTAITNPGASFGAVEGAWFRGASVQIPQRLVHITTLWGVSAVQQEVVPVAGRPEVRPVLPVLLVFDHRVFDGVMASRLLLSLAEIFADPAAEFGPDGARRGPGGGP